MGPQPNNEDEQVLKMMDSVETYLSLLHSLSSFSLRQGWFDFASARYSMGASRVNSVLLDLKEHPAATHLKVNTDEEPHFTLCKWVNREDLTQATEVDKGLEHKSGSIQRHKDSSNSAEAQEDSSLINGALETNGDGTQKERAKSLAVFGALVSPKLRSAQLSFEAALETLVEIANARASMLSAYDKLLEHKDGRKE